MLSCCFYEIWEYFGINSRPFIVIGILLLYCPAHDILVLIAYAQMPSLKIHADVSSGARGLHLCAWEQRRLRRVCAFAQTRLSLRCSVM